MFKDFTIHVFNRTDEVQGILQFTNQIASNLIAMGTHCRKGLAENVPNHTESMVWTYSLKNEVKSRK